jgi:hypothetical protein
MMALRGVLSVVVVALVLVAWFKPVDQRGQAQVDAFLKEALVTYGLVRMVNGLVSVAQGTEMAVSPVGVGLTLAPGEILDPVNDLIERFASVMLVSITSLGLQKLLVEVGESGLFNVLVTAAGLLVLASLWLRAVPGQLARLAVRGFVIALTLRYAVLAVVLASQFAFGQFLAPSYETARDGMQGSASEFGTATRELEEKSVGEAADQDASSWAGWWRSTRASFDPRDDIERIKQAANEIVEYSLDLIAIFVLQTVMLPVLFLFLLYQWLRLVLRSELPALRR